MTSCSDEARLYIFNYVRDVLRTSATTLDFFFNFKKVHDIDQEAFQAINMEVKTLPR